MVVAGADLCTIRPPSMDTGATWTQLDPAGTGKLWTVIASSADGEKLIATVYGG